MTRPRNRHRGPPAMGPGRLEIGSVLARTFSIWGRKLIAFTILSLVGLSPLLAYTLFLLGSPVSGHAFSVWTSVNFWGSQVLGLLVTGAAVFGVVQDLRGAEVGIGTCITEGLRRMPATIGVTLLMWVYLLSAMLAIGILGSLGAGLVGFLTGGSAAVTGLVLIAVLAGAVGWIFSMFWVAVPVCVLEAPGVSASLGRSARLTNRHRWKILLVLFLLFLILGVPGYALRQALLPVTWIHPDAPEVLVATHGQQAVKTYMVLSTLFSMLTGPLTAVASAVVYHDLRTSKEGVGVEEIAKVFD